METTFKLHYPVSKPEGSKYEKDQKSLIILDKIKTT